MNSYSVKSYFIAVLFVALLLLSFASLLAAQDATLEPPTPEPPTLEPPTLEPPTATFTELPSLTATFTETPSPTLTLTETETPTATLTPSATETPFATETPTPSSTTTLLPTPTITVTPGRPDYAAELREWRENQASLPQAQSLSSTCFTDINSLYSIVAPPASGNPPADLYAAIAQAHAPGAASPYPIYLCAGTFPMDESRALFVNVNFYGRGADVSIIQRLPTNIDNGLFFIEDHSVVEFHHLTLTDGFSNGEGGTIKVWIGTARVFDSRVDSSVGNGGGAIDGDRAELARVALTNNTSTGYGGGVRLFTMTAECVRFGSNSAQDYGGAVFMVLDAIIRNSSFTGNAATLEGNQIYAQDGAIDAQQNWWAVSPVVPDEVTSTVDTSNPLSSDPTSHYATGDYYNPASPCRMTDPVPLPTGTCEGGGFGELASFNLCVTPTPTVTPTATAVDPISECNSAASNSQILIDLLSTYRVNATGSWNVGELLELCLGMARTGQALQIHFGGTSPQDTFQRILIAPGRTSIDFGRESIGDPFCVTDNNVSPQQAIVTCYGSNLQFTQYTAVHELGHVLVGRTGGYSFTATGSYFSLIFNPSNNGTPVGAVYDYNPTPGTVFGLFIDELGTPDWVRGRRGWGSNASTPPAPPCSFQQNAFTIRDGTVTPPAPPTQNPIDTERDEAAADMFLNWVYRSLGLAGFENRNQGGIFDCQVIAPTDVSNPGDARHDYLNNVVMPTIATYFPTITPTATP
jgi:hypothetical protein